MAEGIALPGRRVLITGASGFLGRHVLPRLLGCGAEVHALTRVSDLPASAAPAMNATLHRCDVRDGPRIAALVAALRPEVILHLAVAGGRERPSASGDAVATNVGGTSNLLQAAVNAGVRRFVLAGSSLEYGPRSRPLREDDSLLPVSELGATKAAASVLAGRAARSQGLPVILLRLFSVYGPGEFPCRLIPTAIRQTLRGEPIALTPPGLGRDFVFAEDVAEAFQLAVETPLDPGEIFNVGSGEQRMNEDVVAAVQRVAGRRTEVRIGAYAPHEVDTPCWVADTARARERLGWRARTSLEAGLAATIAWQRRQEVS